MTLLDALKTAAASLGSNKLRAGLTVLGIVIGITAVIALMTIGRGVEASIKAEIQSQGTNLLFVHPDFSGTGEPSLTLADAYALVDPVFAPSVTAVAPEIWTSATVVAGRQHVRPQVIGVTSEYEAVRNASVETGSFISVPDVLNISDVAVLSASVATDLFGSRNPVGASIRIDGRRFTVVGVLEDASGGFGGQSYRVLVPITTAYYRLASQRTAQGDVAVQTINVQVESQEVMEQAEEEVSMVLRLRHRITGEDDFEVESLQELIEALETVTSAMVLFLGSVAGVSLLVGGIGIMNIMLVSVTERTREIGIRKAVGAKRRDILLQFILEAITLSLGGGVIGVLIGLVFAFAINGRQLIGPTPLQTGFSADIAAIAVCVATAIGLLSGIYPALRASRMHPIDALRYE